MFTVAASPKYFPSRSASAVFAWGIAMVFCQLVVAQQAAPPAQKKQKPASELIRKQDQPKVIPRVLDQATPSNISVYISLSKQRAYLKVGEEVGIDTPISSGKRAGMTPKGNFLIVQKDPDHRSSLYGAFVNKQGLIVREGVSTKIDSAPSGTTFRGAPMLWFMRFGESLSSQRAEGMHIGNLPGYPASHGCVRLPKEIAPLIYAKVSVGTPVTIGD
ncbi:MAG: L,D-transpeptidase family protein [Verrucomicrobiae bacterium]